MTIRYERIAPSADGAGYRVFDGDDELGVVLRVYTSDGSGPGWRARRTWDDWVVDGSVQRTQEAAVAELREILTSTTASSRTVTNPVRTAR